MTANLTQIVTFTMRMLAAELAHTCAGPGPQDIDYSQWS